MTSADVVIQAFRRAMIILLLVALARSAALLRSNEGRYSPESLELVAFGLLVAVTVAVAIRSTGERTLHGYRGVLTVVTLAAAILATAAVPADRLFTSAHWSWFVIGWFLIAIHVGERFTLQCWLLGLNLVLVLAQARLAGPLDRRDVAEFLIRGVIFTGAQLAFGTAWLVAGRAQRSSAQIREREAKALTEELIADELLVQRRNRHTEIASTTVPLLAGLADGTLAADDPGVRRRSMVEATRLRRLMAESDQAPNPLNHELRACVDVAERAGLQVDVAFRGSAPAPGLASRRRLTEPVIAVLAAARGAARVTVVGTGRDVVVSVLAELADDGAGNFTLDEAGGDVDVSVVRSPGRIWVTARWEAA